MNLSKPNRKHANNNELSHFGGGVFGLKKMSSYKLENGSGTYEKNYVHIMDDSSRITMVRIGDQFPDDINDALTYILEDQIGSSVARLSKSGTVIDREEYYPFGDSSLRTFTKKRYRYTGKEKDLESGLYYYGARYYSAWTCRFISIDPKSTEQPNFTPYLYANNNPIRMNDPSGMQAEDSGSGGGSDGGGGSSDGANDTTENTETHMVKEGDTLSKLAEQYNTTVDALRDANPQTQNRKLDDQINVGEELTIPNTLSGSNNDSANSSFNFSSVNKFSEFPNFENNQLEFKAWDGDKGFWGNMAESDNFGESFAYELMNDLYITLQVFDFDLLGEEYVNPLTGDRAFTNLDGTPQYNQIDSFVNTVATVFPSLRASKPLKGVKGGLGYIQKMNASQFSKTFKGTVINKSAKLRGKINRGVNKVIDYYNNQVPNGMMLFKSKSVEQK